jgi:hypothetical protein
MRNREQIEHDDSWVDPNRDWTSQDYAAQRASLILEVLLDIRDILDERLQAPPR